MLRGLRLGVIVARVAGDGFVQIGMTGGVVVILLALSM